MADRAVVSIADAVHALRQELTVAMAEDESGPLRFGLGAVDLEMSVVIERSSRGDGATRYWVVPREAARNGGYHTVKLALAPVTSRGEVSAVTISADEVPEITRRNYPRSSDSYI